jgi:hypothetical protein
MKVDEDDVSFGFWRRPSDQGFGDTCQNPQWIITTQKIIKIMRQQSATLAKDSKEHERIFIVIPNVFFFFFNL